MGYANRYFSLGEGTCLRLNPFKGDIYNLNGGSNSATDFVGGLIFLARFAFSSSLLPCWQSKLGQKKKGSKGSNQRIRGNWEYTKGIVREDHIWRGYDNQGGKRGAQGGIAYKGRI